MLNNELYTRNIALEDSVKKLPREFLMLLLEEE
jgi:hypothetical protein